MIILTSNGLSSKNLLDETAKHVCKNGRAAIITTASVGYKENDWHIPSLTQELEQLGLSVDYLDVAHDSAELLLQYDVIEINGGNPFYLLNQLRISKAEGILRKIGKEKMLIGVSAGSIVLQKSIELIAQYSPELNDGVQLPDFTGLCLTKAEILPHYSRFLSRFDRFEERAKEYEQKNSCTVIRLNDGEGVFVAEVDFCKAILSEA